MCVRTEPQLWALIKRACKRKSTTLAIEIVTLSDNAQPANKSRPSHGVSHHVLKLLSKQRSNARPMAQFYVADNLELFFNSICKILVVLRRFVVKVLASWLR